MILGARYRVAISLFAMYRTFYRVAPLNASIAGACYERSGGVDLDSVVEGLEDERSLGRRDYHRRRK